MSVEELELIADKIQRMKFEHQIEVLESIGMEEKYSSYADLLDSEEAIKDRYIKIGARTLDKSFYEKSDDEYINDCISNAGFLHENLPIVFQFYDELEHQIMLENKMAICK